MDVIKVPLLDLNAQHALIREELAEAIARVIDKGQFVIGDEVRAFEAEWAKYCKAKYCVGVSSGSDALYLCIRYLRDKKGIFVCATTPLTFWATTEAVIRAGVSPVFSDVEDSSGGLRDPGFNLVVPVHIFGYPNTINKDFRYVLEDSSHAHGQPLRGWAACFSHYPTKNLGALGQAGSIVTDDKDLYEWLLSARGHSEVPGKRFVHHDATGNMRLDELQAAVLRVKLPHLDNWNKRRKEIAKVYRALLAECPGIQLQADHPEHTYHIFAARVKDVRGRDKLGEFLELQGIQAAYRFPLPMHLQPYFQFSKPDRRNKTILERFPNAEAWCSQVINLPIYETMTEDQAEYVAGKVIEWGRLNREE